MTTLTIILGDYRAVMLATTAVRYPTLQAPKDASLHVVVQNGRAQSPGFHRQYHPKIKDLKPSFPSKPAKGQPTGAGPRASQT